MKRYIQWRVAYVLIYLVRKLKVSCIIGFDIQGDKVQTKHQTTFYYNTNFNNVLVKNSDETVFKMPKGKFQIFED